MDALTAFMDAVLPFMDAAGCSADIFGVFGGRRVHVRGGWTRAISLSPPGMCVCCACSSVAPLVLTRRYGVRVAATDVVLCYTRSSTAPLVRMSCTSNSRAPVVLMGSFGGTRAAQTRQRQYSWKAQRGKARRGRNSGGRGR
eukprot:3213599-Rhodomonas_salina.1